MPYSRRLAGRGCRGARNSDLTHTSYRAVPGIRGEINDVWKYDAFGQYGTTQADTLFTSDFSISRTGRALNAVPDGQGGAQCASVRDGTDPGCVPYNIWSLGGVTNEALDYVQIPLAWPRCHAGLAVFRQRAA